jgi:hypothetical protein
VPRRKRDNPQQLYLFDPGPPRGYRRAKHFAPSPSAEEAAAVVRGALADKLDHEFSEGELAGVLWNGPRPPASAVRFIERVIELAEEGDRAGIWKAFQGYGLTVFQAVALALFAELYADDPQASGLVPVSGVERVGAERLKAFAALVAGKAC